MRLDGLGVQRRTDVAIAFGFRLHRRSGVRLRLRGVRLGSHRRLHLAHHFVDSFFDDAHDQARFNDWASRGSNSTLN